MVTMSHLPSGVIVSEVDKVLHEPGVDLAQCETLVWGLQYGLQTTAHTCIRSETPLISGSPR